MHCAARSLPAQAEGEGGAERQGFSRFMKTYPILRSDGSLLGFEVTSAWLTFGPLFKLLRSVEGVTEVRRNWFNEDHITFRFHGKQAVVNEPWGDNSRYWIGLRDPDAATEIDIAPLHQAFKRYRGFLVVTLWPWEHHG